MSDSEGPPLKAAIRLDAGELVVERNQLQNIQYLGNEFVGYIVGGRVGVKTRIALFGVGVGSFVNGAQKLQFGSAFLEREAPVSDISVELLPLQQFFPAFFSHNFRWFRDALSLGLGASIVAGMLTRRDLASGPNRIGCEAPDLNSQGNCSPLRLEQIPVGPPRTARLRLASNFRAHAPRGGPLVPRSDKRAARWLHARVWIWSQRLIP